MCDDLFLELGLLVMRFVAVVVKLAACSSRGVGCSGNEGLRVEGHMHTSKSGPVVGKACHHPQCGRGLGSGDVMPPPKKIFRRLSFK